MAVVKSIPYLRLFLHIGYLFQLSSLPGQNRLSSVMISKGKPSVLINSAKCQIRDEGHVSEGVTKQRWEYNLHRVIIICPTKTILKWSDFPTFKCCHTASMKNSASIRKSTLKHTFNLGCFTRCFKICYLILLGTLKKTRSSFTVQLGHGANKWQTT